ncbi:MAG: AAA family ATPase [Lentimicrobiaceae bacterium]|nr:AAA family ATPase [Lentimicrobiaceae bacterium]
MIIIGITGTIGAGKGVIVDYLINKYNFNHFSVRQFLIQEIKKRNMEVNRDSMVVVANELRTLNSPSYITDQLYKQAAQLNQNAVIESIRTPGEVTSLRKLGEFILFAVDADPKIRYNRIVLRNSETDNISYETFLQNEEREMSSDNPNEQNIKKCMQMADHHFYNDSTLNELYSKVEATLEVIFSEIGSCDA